MGLLSFLVRAAIYEMFCQPMGSVKDLGVSDLLVDKQRSVRRRQMRERCPP